MGLPVASSSISLSKYRIFRISGSSRSSRRTPQTTPVIFPAFGCSESASPTGSLSDSRALRARLKFHDVSFGIAQIAPGDDRLRRDRGLDNVAHARAAGLKETLTSFLDRGDRERHVPKAGSIDRGGHRGFDARVLENFQRRPLGAMPRKQQVNSTSSRPQDAGAALVIRTRQVPLRRHGHTAEDLFVETGETPPVEGNEVCVNKLRVGNHGSPLQSRRLRIPLVAVGCKRLLGGYAGLRN